MPIEPDTKDWTWVLERPCPDCGFEAGTVSATDVGRLLRENAGEWRDLLADPDARRRPSDDTWSALEYACHVRDVFRLYEQRLTLMLTEDDPTFANWDQDVSAVEGRYDEQDPAEVATDIELAGKVLGDHFDAVPAAGWDRTGTRSDGAHFTVDTFARYLLHDPVHHVDDVVKGYATLVRVTERGAMRRS